MLRHPSEWLHFFTHAQESADVDDNSHGLTLLINNQITHHPGILVGKGG